MTSPIPVWLLDIDGVVSAIVRKASHTVPTHVWPRHQWIDTEAYSIERECSYRIVAAAPVVDFLKAVHDLGLAEIRWHTTWQESATHVAQAIGLPEFPVHPAPEYTPDAWESGYGDSDNGVWWKVPAVFRAAIDEQRSIVWTDDNIPDHTTLGQRQSLASKTPTLMVAPDTYTGLTRKHLRQIREFLELHREQHAGAHEGEPVAPQRDQG